MMTPFQIYAPSRLHFGLLSFGQQSPRPYGGAGVMIQEPGLVLDCQPSDAFVATGPLDERISTFARSWQRYHHIKELPAIEFSFQRVPPEHMGLGVGTQVGLSVAAALCYLSDLPIGSPAELAESVGRAQRSCVGTYGFLQGGVIVERGQTVNERISPLDCRLEPPAEWRIALIRPTQSDTGLHGQEEKSAFSEAPQVPLEVTRKLEDLLRKQIIPSLAGGDFATFSDAIYEYGYQAGMCFASSQGGPYNGPRLAQLVQGARELDVLGVGQSSWGPTLFAWLPHVEAAEEFQKTMMDRYPCAVDITRVNTTGFELNAS